MVVACDGLLFAWRFVVGDCVWFVVLMIVDFVVCWYCVGCYSVCCASLGGLVLLVS